MLTHLTVSWGKRAESVILELGSVTLGRVSVTLEGRVSPWPCDRCAIMYPAPLLRFPSIRPGWHSLRAIGKGLVGLVRLKCLMRRHEGGSVNETPVLIVGSVRDADLRNTRHCERSEAIQGVLRLPPWIASSLRSSQ